MLGYNGPGASLLDTGERFAEGFGRVATIGTYRGGGVGELGNYKIDKNNPGNWLGGWAQIGSVGTYNPFKAAKQVPLPPVSAMTDVAPQITTTQDDINKMSDDAKTREDAYLQQTLTGADFAQRAVDQQLAGLIQQTGFQTGLQKSAIGAGMSQRGLLRSGMTGGALGSADLAKQQQIGQLTSLAEEQKGAIRSQAESVQQDVQNRRRDYEQKLKIQELENLKNIKYQQDLQTQQEGMLNYLNGLDISAKDKAAMMSMYSGIASAVGLGAGMYAGSRSGSTQPYTFSQSTSPGEPIRTSGMGGGTPQTGASNYNYNIGPTNVQQTPQYANMGGNNMPNY